MVKLEELDDRDTSEAAIMGVTKEGEDGVIKNFSRGETVIAKLRDEHLNEEEKKLPPEVLLSIKMCFTWSEINYVVLKPLDTLCN